MRFSRVRFGEDFYAVLGVRVDVEAAELRRAWRRLAVRWHPDRAGAEGAGMFAKLAEAYEVLSDPLARAAYDACRGRALRQAQDRGPRGETSARSVEPGRETATSAGPRVTRPSAPAIMLGRLCTHLSTLIACGAAEIEDDGVITLVLRDDEAAQGGMATIPMNVEVWCPQCCAQGRATTQRSANCVRCGGTRTVEELYAAWLAIPPGVAEGEVLIPSAELPGMVSPVRFRVRLRGAG